MARQRHSGGANYTFSDGHAKWFKAPNDHTAPNRSGMCWRSPKAGSAYANCTAWFREVGD
jgi:prepilin-type processing-associated H-X9-DG protein